MTKPVVQYSGSAFIVNWYDSGMYVAKIRRVLDHPVLGECPDVRTSLVMDVLDDGSIITLNTIYKHVDGKGEVMFINCEYADIVHQREKEMSRDN